MSERVRDFKADSSSPTALTGPSWPISWGWRDAALLVSPVGVAYIIKELLIDAGIDALWAIPTSAWQVPSGVIAVASIGIVVWNRRQRGQVSPSKRESGRIAGPKREAGAAKQPADGWADRKRGAAEPIDLAAASRRKGRKGRKKGHDRVTLMLNWFDQAQFAGFYLAKDREIFRDYGLDVSLVSGPLPASVRADQLLEHARAEFVLMSSAELIVAASQARGVRGVATVLQTHPGCWFFDQSLGITSPRDLIGKTVAVTGDMGLGLEYRVGLRLCGLDPLAVRKDIKGFKRWSAEEAERRREDTILEVEVSRRDLHELTHFSALDVSTGHQFSQYQSATDRFDGELGLLTCASFGINLPGDMLVTSQALIDTDPDLVQRFVSASCTAWREAVEPSQASAVMESVERRCPGGPRAHQLRMLRMLRPYVLGTASRPRVGHIDAAHWTAMQRPLLEAEEISAIMDPAEVVQDCFVRRHYAEDSGAA